MSESLLRQLPAVHALLARPELADLPREPLARSIRAILDECRRCILDGVSVDLSPDAIIVAVRQHLAQTQRPLFRRVINATGIILHTNLGRSILAESAARAAHQAATGYLNLELDLTTGQRSSRQDFVRQALMSLSGAESATVVNNCAAATVITLRALASGREVIVSRGQLIEIGGSFRIPDIMEVSGAKLREVGTTNITRLRDYEAAIGPNTAALMLIHPSNYRVRGFTESVELAELVALGRKYDLPVIDDCGSGAWFDLSAFGLHDEPIIPLRIAAGADVVLFSGDKLMGGPQAGIILGRAKWVQAIERDPLMRAFRLDKMTLAALEATALLYRDATIAFENLPTLRMLRADLCELRARAERMSAELRKFPHLESVEILESETFIGGGAVPDQALPAVTIGIRAQGLSESDLARKLRNGDPAIMGRLHNDRFLIDLRTILPDQESLVIEALRTLPTS